MPTFSATEKQILATLKSNKSLIFNDKLYSIIECDKPTTIKGEPKTDIYILLQDENKDFLEVKISIKQKNADFLENKITDTRALEIFGNNWQDIIQKLITPIKCKFFNKKLIYKESFGHADKGTITLGWRFEITNKPQGELSGLLPVELAEEVLSGKNLANDKKNSYINKKIVQGSGIAEYILPNADTLDPANINLIFSSLIPIKDYIKQEGVALYFACKASNYRTLYIPKEKTETVHKIEGNRHLSVYVDWKDTNNKLDYEICFNNPLSTKTKAVAKNLSDTLKRLGIKNTNDISIENFSHFAEKVFISK